jgi:hypothetical protein
MNEGREEGRKEGRCEGRCEGRNEGRVRTGRGGGAGKDIKTGYQGRISRKAGSQEGKEEDRK